MTDGQAIRDFIRAAARLDPALARWIAAAVWRGLTPSRRRLIRNELLREAAKLLSPASAWGKSHVLAELARPPGARPDATTVPGLVALALRMYPGRSGLSPGQAFRVVSRKSHVEMTAGAVVDSKSDFLGGEHDA